jgi:hypothetical protein
MADLDLAGVDEDLAPGTPDTLLMTIWSPSMLEVCVIYIRMHAG